MRRIKIALIPRWLDRVAKETGIAETDLLDLEKLSCILSRRDVELYQMANFDIADCLIATGFGTDRQSVSACLFDCWSVIPALDLEKRAAYANVPAETFIYGATATRHGEGEDTKYRLCASIGDQDTLLLRIALADDETGGGTLATVLAEQLHALLDFKEFASTSVFKQYVKEIQIN
jgi:hypothetical protein